MKKQLLLATALIAALAMAAPAAATPIIDFHGQLGEVTITTGGISGSTEITSVLIQGTPNYVNNAFEVVGGVLTFNSAGAVPNFIITGSVPALGIGLAAPVQLLTGSIVGWDLQAPSILHIYGPDVKYAGLMEAAGLPLDTQWAYFGSDLYGNPIAEGSSTFYATSVDIRNTQVPDAGSSLLLLGMGLVGLRMWRKR